MTHTTPSKTKLPFRTMMFFQYLLLAVWWMPLAAFLSNKGLDGDQKGLVLSSMAFGCLLSPLMGLLADRYFRAERVLAFLNLTTAAMLLLSTFIDSPTGLIIVFTVLMCAHMPTWSLASSIAMQHTSPEDFPGIRVFGSVGWVATGLFSIIALYGFDMVIDGTVIPIYCGAVSALVAAILNFTTLPATPPTQERTPISVLDLFGLNTLKLAKDKNLLVFFLASFLFMIPFALYWSYASQYLQEVGFRFITLTLNWGPAFEIIIILSIPFIIHKLGYKWTMVVGVGIMAFRYLMFSLTEYTGIDNFLFGGVFVHGFVFGCFMMAGQMYMDKVAPVELKSQAQGFMFLITLGAGLMLGNWVVGKLMNIYAIQAEGSLLTVDWRQLFNIAIWSSLAVMLMLIFLFKEKKEVKQ